MSNGIERVFSGVAETGSITKTKLSTTNMRAALKDSGCMEFLPQGDKYGFHEVRTPSFWFYGRRAQEVHHLSTLERLLTKNFTYVGTRYADQPVASVRFMRMGFGLVAEALKIQKEDNTKTQLVQGLLGASGNAFAVSFQMLARGSRQDIAYSCEGPSGLGDRPLHQLPNFLRRPQGVKIAHRLFEAAQEYNY